MRLFSLCIVALLTIPLHPGSAVASPELRTKLEELAKTILSATKGQAVTVGVFSPTNLAETNAGPGIEGLLSEALQRQQADSASPSGKYEVKGDYTFARSRNPQSQGLKLIKIKARIVEKEFADDLLETSLEVELDHTKTIAEVLQITAALPPDGSKQERNEKLDKARTAPTVSVEQTRISSSDKSPYGVELLVKPLREQATTTAIPRTATVEKGLAFVDIRQDELYEVRVQNQSDKPVAVSLTIDGLDMYHFSKDRTSAGLPRFSHLIVDPKSSATIVGWHNSVAGTENYRSFLVSAYGQGAASKEGITARGAVGVIHVQFAHCRPLAPGQKAVPGLETGFGPPREVKQEIVSYEIEPPHDFVSVRYTR